MIQLSKTFLFQAILFSRTIQFSISMPFYLTHRYDHYQVLPLRVRVDLGEMAIKGYSAFSKAPALLEPHHQIVWCHNQDTRWGGSYPSTEKQSVYSTAPADWAIILFISLEFGGMSPFQGGMIVASPPLL